MPTNAELIRLLANSGDSDVPAFEDAVASCFESPFAVAVSSGTAALHCALAALGIGPGDEVIVPALSVVMSVVPVLYLGATPVFVDCQVSSIDFDYEDLESKLTSRTRVILPVHLWGCAYDMVRLIEFAHTHGLAVVEDACQAHGSRWDDRLLGTWGIAGCFSMQDRKLISVGEGGFVLTSNPEIAEKCRGFRSHWAHPKDPALSYTRLGWNYRLSRIQAVFGIEQIQQFEQVLSEQRRKGALLRQHLDGIKLLQPYSHSTRAFHNDYHAVFLVSPEYIPCGVASALDSAGIVNSVGTFGLRPVMQRGVLDAISDKAEAPNAELLLSRAIALGFRREDSDHRIVELASKVSQVVSAYTRGAGT